MCERSTQARSSALLRESCVAIGKMKEEILNNQQQSWGGKGKSYCSLGQPSFLLPQHTQNRRTKAACGKLTVGLLWALIRLENFGCASSGHHYVVSIKDTLLNKLLILAIKTAIKPKPQRCNVVVAVNSRSFLGCSCCPYLPCDVCMRCTLSAGAVQIFTSFSLEEVIKNQYRRICRQVSISTLSLYKRDWILTDFSFNFNSISHFCQQKRWQSGQSEYQLSDGDLGWNLAPKFPTPRPKLRDVFQNSYQKEKAKTLPQLSSQM